MEHPFNPKEWCLQTNNDPVSNVPMIEMKFNDLDGNSPLPRWLCANAKGGRGMSILIILVAVHYNVNYVCNKYPRYIRQPAAEFI